MDRAVMFQKSVCGTGILIQEIHVQYQDSPHIAFSKDIRIFSSQRFRSQIAYGNFQIELIEAHFNTLK